MKLLPFFLLLFIPLLATAQGSMEEYQNLIKEAKEAQKKGQYDLAINKLFSARVNRPEKDEEIKARILNVFQEVNKQRELAITEKSKAEKRAIENYANDLAYKSQITLERGDRTTAFRLAELTHLYIQDDNPNVNRALFEALYFNDNPDTTHRLSWNETFYGHTGTINDLAYSKDAKRLVSYSDDYTVKIWDTKSGKEILTIGNKSEPEYRFALSPDGKKLATKTKGDSIRIWDLNTNSKIKTLVEPSTIFCIGFSPDGKKIAICSVGGVIKIWDIENGKNTLTIIADSSRITCIKYLPDGNRIATGTWEGPIKIWDLRTGKKIFALIGHDDNVECMSISSDGKLLASGSYDNKVKIWDLERGVEILTLSGHRNAITSIAFSPDGKRVATGSFDNTVRIWDLSEKREIFLLKGDVFSIPCVAFSPDGKKFAVGINNIIKTWDLIELNEALTFHGQVNSIENGITCKSCGYWGDITSSEFYLVAFSPDGKKIAATGKEKIKIWNLENMENITTLNGQSGDKTGLAFSPNGKWLAVGSGNSTANIWDLDKGSVLLSIDGLTNRFECVKSVAFSPNGKIFATVSADKSVKLWDLGSGKNIFSLTGHRNEVASLDFSPNGKYLATCSEDSTVRVWDTYTGKQIFIIEGLLHNLCATFSPDGKRLATGSDNNDGILIWDWESKKIILTLGEISTRISSVAFSPNGRSLATCPGNHFRNLKEVNIWDLDSGKKILSINGHSGSVLTVEFSPDGKRLATGSYDGTAKVWELTSNALIKSATNNRRLSVLSLSQLHEFNLENILDIHLENESKLITSGETWQIATFADLYAQKISLTDFPKKEDYQRALRLYRTCLASGENNEYFIEKLMDLEEEWKKKKE